MVRSLNESNIPDDWKFDLLDKFTIRCSGHTPNKKITEYWNGNVKWISLSDSSNLDNGYISKTKKEISEEGIKNSSAAVHPAETVVLSRDAGVGKSAVMAVPMAVSQHFIAWQCDNTYTINSWYLYNWLQILKPEFERQAVGSTIKTIGLPYFKKLKIALPPIVEQNKIAKVLNTWDIAIKTTEKILDNSQLQRKALMQKLLAGKERFKYFTEDWIESRIDRVCDIKKGKDLSKGKLEDNGINKCILYGELFTIYSEVICNVRSRTDVNEGIESVYGDVLIPSSTTTSGIDLANATALLEDGVLLGGDINILRPDMEKIIPEFLSYLITHNKKYEISSRAQGITIIHLYGNDIKPIKILIPPKEEQQKIAEILMSSDHEMNLLRKEISYLKKEKKALMQQLLTGKRRVKVDA